jgi:hypothetical protein
MKLYVRLAYVTYYTRLTKSTGLHLGTENGEISVSDSFHIALSAFNKA